MIAIDWGTSSLRAYLVEEGRVLSSRATHQGVLHVQDGQFQHVFAEITRDWQGDVYLAGMIGSSKGWRETSYCRTPFTLERLGQHLVDISDLTGRASWIVPGVQQEEPVNMMRGEEVQILGAMEQSQSDCMILCGTHSKHAQVADGALLRFETYMTGELYALLQQHSILAGPEDWSQSDFLRGVEAGSADANLLQQLFGVRAYTLNQSLSHPRAYLSGLLLGTELKDAPLLREARRCTLIGSTDLMRLYALALSELYSALEINIVSAEAATLSGLEQIHRSHYDRS